MRDFETFKPPCPKRPYKLGSMHTVTGIYPKRKANGYQAFERFRRERIDHFACTLFFSCVNDTLNKT